MFRNVIQAATAALVFSAAVGHAQVTSPLLPGPSALPSIMSPATPSRQTVTIIGGKLFPPNVYARMIDTIEFKNDSDTAYTVSHPDGEWTTGEIPAGQSVEITYLQIRGSGNSTNEPNCNGWINSGGQANGLAERCASHRQFQIDGGATQVVEPAVVHMTLNGTLTNATNWNGYDLVPTN